MAASPPFKTYIDGEFRASFKYPEDASLFNPISHGYGKEDARLVVKYQHSLIVWREGEEEFSMSDSCDDFARVVRERIGEDT